MAVRAASTVVSSKADVNPPEDVGAGRADTCDIYTIVHAIVYNVDKIDSL